ncbi:cold shock domain-containing protein [Coleofasciculus sp. F4-SAH-05]|uniref:cold shock domain-containing protein n=1 Tax=Coleofasciculus sp. F4-SAH-05 TaxID=3069525 RepID=UPI0032FFD604
MKPILYKGRLKTWKDDRGFGFIKPDDGNKDVFLHISALKGTSRRPKVGDIILYELATDSEGKIRASNASIQGATLRSLDLFKNQTQSPLPKKHHRKKRGLVEILMSLGIIAVIAIFAMEFRASDSPSPVSSVTKPECNIKGNISFNKGKKVYHLPGMEDYESTFIDPAKGERWFCTESEAIASGWHKAPR